MTDFILALEASATQKQAQLRGLFDREYRDEEEGLYRLFRDGRHWHPLPGRDKELRDAFAVDGGLRTLDLANGALLVIAQALLLGERVEEAAVDVEIVRGSLLRSTADRFVDLFRQRLEVQLAANRIRHLPPGGLLLLDGALYSGLPQLYPLRAPGLEDPTERLVHDYQALFDACEEGRLLVSVAKSSRETLFSDLLQAEAGIPDEERLRLPDSELIYRWTDQKAGLSTPVLLGTRSFTAGSCRALLEPGSSVARMPAILSFFLRPEDYAPAWRVDVPGICVGRKERITDLEAAWATAEELEPVVAALLADYGGPQVYNALLYAVDQEVRLSSDRFGLVYLPLLKEILHVDLSSTLSAARFLIP